MSKAETQKPQAATSTRGIFKTALPMLASLLLEQAIAMTDAIFLGRYGEIELGSAALGGVVFLILIMQGFGYSVGAQSLMARANGAGKSEEIGFVFRQSGLFLALLSAALLAVTLAAAYPLMGWIAKSVEVQRAAGDYVFWRACGLPFAYIGILVRSFYVALLRTNILTWSSVVMVASNCLLNGILIFGWGPFPELGIAGAAIASALSEVVCLVFLGLYLKAQKDHIRYGLIGSLSFDLPMQRRLIFLGRWLMIQETVAFVAWLYFFAAVEHVSDRALAISNVVRQLGSFLFLFVHAFGTTCGSITANLYGANDWRRINGVVRRGLWLSFSMVIPVGLFFAIFPEAVLSLFTNHEEVIADAKPAFFVMIASYVITLASYHLFFIVAAMGYAKQSFRSALAASVVYVFYVAFITSVSDNVALIWTSDTVYGLLLGAGCWRTWKNTEWQPGVAAETADKPEGLTDSLDKLSFEAQNE